MPPKHVPSGSNAIARVENRAIQRARAVQKALSAPASFKLDLAKHQVRARLQGGDINAEPETIIANELSQHFLSMTEDQATLLSLYVAVEIRDALSMDSRSKLLASISTLLKKCADTDNAVVDNLK